jgi:Ca2+-binding RTX toxin-like protein
MRGTIRLQDFHFRFQEFHFRNAVSLPAVQRSVETTTVAAAKALPGGLLGDVLAEFYGMEGSNVFVGTAKDETLYGNGGNDTLNAGVSADRFVFTSPAESHGFYDRITDCQRGIDRIDLSAINAKPNTDWPYTGDDAFTFIGYKTFSGK